METRCYEDETWIHWAYLSACKRLVLSPAFGIDQSSFLKSKGFSFCGAILALYVLGGIDIESLAVTWEAWIVLFLL